MRLRLYDGLAGQHDLVSGCVVVCTDNGTPVAVALDIGKKELRTTELALKSLWNAFHLNSGANGGIIY